MTLGPQDPRPGRRGYPSLPPVEPNTETTRRAERPRDIQGLPMLTVGDVAPDLGITHPENYNHAAYREVPHYVDSKSGDLTPTSNTRVWFALQDIVDHFARKSGAGKAPETKSASELAHASRHAHWNNVHQQALRTEEVNRESGIWNGDLWNQPDIRNRGISRRMLHGVREQSEDDPATGDLVGRSLGLGSNLANPVKHGHMVPVEDNPSEGADYSNPHRPRIR